MSPNIPAPSQVYVRCSDPNVICSSDVVQHGEPHDVVFKVCHRVGSDAEVVHSGLKCFPSILFSVKQETPTVYTQNT